MQQTKMSRRHEEMKLRMLGQTVSFNRSQWEELRDVLEGNSAWALEERVYLLERIRTLLGD